MNMNPLLTHAQSMPGYCEKKYSEPTVEIKQKKTPYFFKVKSGVFCSTPVVSKNGSFVTGCDNANVYILSNTGAVLKTIPVDHDGDYYISSNPEISALPNTKPEQFVVTSYGDKIIIKFDITGKIISKVKLDSFVTKPIAISSTEYFVGESEGKVHFYIDDKSSVTIDLKTTSLNTPTTRNNSLGSKEVVISDRNGNLFVLNDSGLLKTMKLSNVGLSNALVAPDGLVWVSDETGIMNIVNVENQEIKTIKPGDAVKFSLPVFTKNGKIAFAGNEYIYIYDSKKLDQPESIFDFKFHERDYQSGAMNTYHGPLISGSILDIVEFDDGKEAIYVSTYGGFELINTDGAIIGIYSFTAGDAENYSLLNKLSDGSFIYGTYYGVDRISLHQNPSVSPIVSSAWGACSH